MLSRSYRFRGDTGGKPGETRARVALVVGLVVVLVAVVLA